jgi:hypothetical protein
MLIEALPSARVGQSLLEVPAFLRPLCPLGWRERLLLQRYACEVRDPAESLLTSATTYLLHQVKHAATFAGYEVVPDAATVIE